MDLLDRVNALTDDQLQMVAERDDASGVLAAYRLAELRGLPMPDREAVILGEGYVIVAQSGQIQKIPVDSVEKIVRQEGGQYCVYSEDGEQAFGCYDTMSQAEERLRQIHFFRQAIREGTFVSWNSSGGRARGQVEHVMYEGVLGIPDSEFQINAEPDDPAVLIRIWRRGADGWAATETLVGHKMSTLTRIEPLSKLETEKETFVPPEGVQEAAQRALDWIAEGHAGEGFTDVGRARAAQLARGDGVSADTIRRMASYLARHRSDSEAEGFNAGEEGFPSAGRVAWDAWGGDAAVSWTRSIVDRLEGEEKGSEEGLLSGKRSCPEATLDVGVNLLNRKTAIDVAMYGPLNPSEPNEEYWQKIAEEFGTGVEEAKSTRCGNCAAFDITSGMKDCIAEGVGGQGAFDVVDAGELGYCNIFKFKCASARTCSAWVSGGPITDETVDKSLSRDGKFLRKQSAQRFTLGPLYVPDFMDAHGEWTDAEELQQGVWEWVRSGDRTIYLQHDRSVRAGEWVEVMTMPQPWTVHMVDGAGNEIGQVTYPAGTVFLGVIWDEDAWRQIVAGELRGYSIGGFSDRVFADLPEAAVREGIELEQETEPSLAKSIAEAVALAMKDAQPVVNVVMPEQGKATKVRRIERDEHGNIARIIEEDA